MSQLLVYQKPNSDDVSNRPLSAIKRLALSLLVILVLPISAATAQSSDYRTWTDSTGQHKVSAKLIAQTDKEITLEKADGSKISLPLDKLSLTDREHLRSLLAKSEPEVDPFSGGQPVEELSGGRQRIREPKTPPAANTSDDTDDQSNADRGPESSTERKHKPRAVKFNSASQWNYHPSAAAAPAARSKARISLSSPLFGSGRQQITETLFSSNGRVLLVHSKTDGNNILTVIDLIAGNVISHEQLPKGNNINIAISPSGTSIAVCVNQLGQTIEIWTLNGNKLIRDSKSIRTATQLFYQAKKLVFAGESHLFCWGSNSCLIDLGQNQVEYEIDIDTYRIESVMNADTGFLGLFQLDKFHLLRMADGEVVGSLSFGESLKRASFDSVSVAMQRQHLIVFTERERCLWDLQTGQPKSTTPLPAFRDLDEPAHFLSDSLVLQGGEVFHLTLPNPVWNIELPTHGRMLFDRDRCWLLTNEALIPVEALTIAQSRDIDQAVQLAQNFPFLKRGTRVGLDVDFRHLGSQAEAAKTILLKRLQDLGCEIDQTASLQLRADVRQNVTGNFTIERRINKQIERTTATFAPLVYDLMLVQNKRVIWRIERPSSGELNENAHEARDRLTARSTDFFATCELPTKPSPLIKPPPPGVSRIRADGVVD